MVTQVYLHGQVCITSYSERVKPSFTKQNATLEVRRHDLSTFSAPNSLVH